MNNNTKDSVSTELQLLPKGIIRDLWRAKRFIIVNFFVVSILAAGFSLLLPKWYRSSFTILPSSAGGSELMVGGTGVVSTLSALGFGGASEEINSYITIIKSRSLREVIISEFDLMEEFRAKTIESVLKRLDSNTELVVTDEGALVFGIFDRDSLRAKAMADVVLRELGKTSVSLGTMTGQRNRRFIKTRIDSIENDLAEVEQAVRDFTARYGTFDLPTQLAVVIEQLVQMEIILAEAEIEYNIASASLNAQHPDVAYLRIQRDETRAKVEELISGKGSSNLLPDLQQLPDIAVEYARLTRDVTILNALLEFLYPQYEQARLQETRDEPALLVVDYPKVPQWKAKPKRSHIVLACGLFSIIISCAWIIIRTQIQAKKRNQAVVME